jgi:hypothetical protein
LAKLEAVASNERAQKRLQQIERGSEIMESIFTELDIRKIKEGNEPLEAVLAHRLVKAADQLEGEAIGDPLVVATLQNRLGYTVAIHGRSCIPTTTNGAHPHAGQPALVGWYNRPLPRHHPAGVLTLPPAITAPTRRCRYGLPGSAEPCTRCRPGTPGDIISSLHPATTAPLAAPRRRLPTPAHTRRPNDLAARTSPSPSRYAHTNAVPSHHASPA